MALRGGRGSDTHHLDTKPRCRLPRISHQRSSILSSTTYTLNQIPSNRAPSSPNHGFHGPEGIFLIVWSSTRNTDSLESWMKAFPDPSTSPAHQTRHLVFSRFPITAADATTVLAHIRSFSRITILEVVTSSAQDDHRLPLVPLHGLSPTLKSLCLRCNRVPVPEILSLICSFPLLEDLALSHSGLYGDTRWRDVPSTSPKLSGVLVLDDVHPPITRGLLSLPNGLHFSKITLLRPVENAELTMEVVSRCSNTLEYLNMTYLYWGAFSLIPSVSRHLTSVWYR